MLHSRNALPAALLGSWLLHYSGHMLALGTQYTVQRAQRGGLRLLLEGADNWGLMQSEEGHPGTLHRIVNSR